MRAVARPALLVALLVTTMIAAELPPLRALAAWIDAREPSLLRIVAVVLALGFALFFIGILKLMMDRDETLSHSEAEDVARSVRLAARPVFSRSSRYRVIGAAAGRGGADAFRLHEMRAAWRSGAVWREPLWRRRRHGIPIYSPLLESRPARAGEGCLSPLQMLSHPTLPCHGRVQPSLKTRT